MRPAPAKVQDRTGPCRKQARPAGRHRRSGSRTGAGIPTGGGRDASHPRATGRGPHPDGQPAGHRLDGGMGSGVPAAEAPLADWDPPLLVAAQGDTVRDRRQGGPRQTQRAARLPGRPLLRPVAALVRALSGALVGGLVSVVVEPRTGARLSEAFSGPSSQLFFRPLAEPLVRGPCRAYGGLTGSA